MPNLPGPKIPFYAPFSASKRMQANVEGAENDKVYARVLCKDSIGMFLGFSPAPYRAGRFKDGPATQPNANLGKRFAINEKVSANPYKFFLKPGTTISGAKVDFSAGTAAVASPFPVKSISVWMPGHVTVTDVLMWINSGKNVLIADGSNAPLLLPNYGSVVTVGTPVENLALIFAVVTPNERKYNIRTVLVPTARPMFNPLMSVDIPPPQV